MDVPGRPTTVLVEGESDRVAVETLAVRSGHDLVALGASVVPMGGATSVRGFLERYGPAGAGHRLLVLCDAAEQAYVERAVERAGLTGAVPLHVCRADLEDELVRRLGTDAVLEVIDGQGELRSFRLLQRQPAQRDQPLTAQLARFFAGRSGHKITYGRLLVEAMPEGEAPEPLARLLVDLQQ